jgi:hypothetical protein
MFDVSSRSGWVSQTSSAWGGGGGGWSRHTKLRTCQSRFVTVKPKQKPCIEYVECGIYREKYRRSSKEDNPQ